MINECSCSVRFALNSSLKRSFVYRLRDTDTRVLLIQCIDVLRACIKKQHCIGIQFTSFRSTFELDKSAQACRMAVTERVNKG